MNYIEDVKNYIEENLITIDSKNYKNALTSFCNTSFSKLDKDFKANEGVSVRKYFFNEKLKLYRKIARDEPFLARQEIQAKINHNFTDRAFRNQLKKNTEFEEFTDPFPMYFFRNKKVFEEILVRFILLNKWAKIKKWHNKGVTIDINVENTILQFNNSIIPLESDHTYFIDIDLDSYELGYSMIITNEFDKEQCQVPNSLNPYFSVLLNIDNHINEQVKYTLKDAIHNFKSYYTIDKLENNPLLIPSFINVNLEIKDHQVLEINKESEFIKLTDSITNEIKNNLIGNSEKLSVKNFGIKLSELKEYGAYVQDRNYKSMRMILDRVSDQLLKSNTLDLIIEITDCPYFNSIEFDAYEPMLSMLILKEIQLKKLNNIVDFIIEFKIKTDKILDENEDADFEAEDILWDLLDV